MRYCDENDMDQAITDPILEEGLVRSLRNTMKTVWKSSVVDTVDHIAGSGGGCVEAGGILPRPPPPLQQPHQPCTEVLHPKKQAVIDRLRRRVESYRRRQTECVPRFDQSFSGVCEQQNLETSALQKRFLEGKSKRTVKKGGDRQQVRQEQQQPQSLQLQNQLQGQVHPLGLTSNLHSSVHVQQKFLKRPADSGLGSGSIVNIGSAQGSPPGKLQRVNSGGAQENLTKFSVEIVQQLEFTSAADSQPQQISTNVTVKALTNTSVKSESGTPLLECKREPDNDFADLDQCAAALEKDNFPGFSDLIGEEAIDAISTSDAFQDLFVLPDLSECNEFMKEFDFEDKVLVDNVNNSDDRNSLISDSRIVKVEEGTQGVVKRSGSPNGLVNRGFVPRPGAGGGYGGELSPAAQTLKQMAEQHQHKQMGLGSRGARSPYGELQDYLAGQGGFRKQDQVKQEPFPPSYKPYSPYGSPSPGNGSPGYLPRGAMGGPSPPRPPSGPPPQPNNGSLHINQAQHLHISHPSHGIQQVSGGQHMQLTGDLGPGNVSVAAHQGMYFGQQPGNNSPHQHHATPASGASNNDTYTVSQSQTINFTQQSLRQRQQQAQQQATSPMAPGGSPGNNNMGNVPTSVNGNVPNMPGMGVNNPGMGMSMSNMAMAREHHAKLLQQQQQHMLRAQQQQQQMGGQLRPPPPDYKATQGPIGSSLAQQQVRFAQNSIRRAINQPIPPSGPMMRGGMVYGGGGGRYIGPGNAQGQGVPAGAGLPDWRHQLLIQQQQDQFVRHPNMQGFQQQQNQGGFSVNNASIQQQLQQQQLLRSQQQRQQMMSGQQHPHQLPPHLLAQQNQSLSMQGQVHNIHMNQSQSISIHQNNGGNMNGAGGPSGPNGPQHQQQNGPMSSVTSFPSLQNNNVMSSFPGQPADFNLDFLENIPSGDSSNFTAQELLNSLDSDLGCNLPDII